MIILDTYDFNKNDSDWRVQIACDIEETGTIREYYELILVTIPLYRLLQWLIEFRFNNL